MESIEEIKNRAARQLGKSSYRFLYSDYDLSDDFVNNVSEEYGKQVAIEQREACIYELKTKGISFNTNHALNIISSTKLVVD